MKKHTLEKQNLNDSSRHVYFDPDRYLALMQVILTDRLPTRRKTKENTTQHLKINSIIFESYILKHRLLTGQQTKHMRSFLLKYHTTFENKFSYIQISRKLNMC